LFKFIVPTTDENVKSRVAIWLHGAVIKTTKSKTGNSLVYLSMFKWKVLKKLINTKVSTIEGIVSL
jgi:hypothetical protein